MPPAPIMASMRYGPSSAPGSRRGTPWSTAAATASIPRSTTIEVCSCASSDSTSRRSSASSPHVWARNAPRAAGSRSIAASYTPAIRRHRSGFMKIFGPHESIREAWGQTPNFRGLTPSLLLVEPLEQMRGRVLADPAAQRSAHFRAVAEVHPAPDARVAFFGVDLSGARVATNQVAASFEVQRELIRVEPHRVEPERGSSDRRVSGGVFGMDRRGDEGSPSWIGFGLAVPVGVAGADRGHRAPGHVRVLRFPAGEQRIRHRGDSNRLETR